LIDYLNILKKILEYAKSNPFKKIIVIIGLQHYDQIAKEQELIKELAGQGVIIVAGAGNDNTDNFSYPGAYPEVINVAAIEGRGFIGYGEDKKVKKPAIRITGKTYIS